MQTELYNIKGEKIGNAELPEEFFGQEVKKGFLHEVIIYYRAHKRIGTASTKTRAEVRGGGRKPWKQKGTGRARAGSNRSPLWRKGGVIFGPKPRDFKYDIPKKKLRKALVQSLSAKFSGGEIKVVDSLDLFVDEKKEVKTKVVQNMLSKLELPKNVIVVKTRTDAKFTRASSNIPKLRIMTFKQLNAYDVLSAEVLLIEKDAVSQ